MIALSLWLLHFDRSDDSCRRRPRRAGSGTIVTTVASSMTRSIGVVRDLIVNIGKLLSRGPVVALGQIGGKIARRHRTSTMLGWVDHVLLFHTGKVALLLLGPT